MNNQPAGSFDADKPFEILPDGPEQRGDQLPAGQPSSWRNSLSFIVPLSILCVICGAFSYSFGYDRGIARGREKAQREFARTRAERTEVARIEWQMARDDVAAQRAALAEAERREAESKAEYERVQAQHNP